MLSDAYFDNDTYQMLIAMDEQFIVNASTACVFNYLDEDNEMHDIFLWSSLSNGDSWQSNHDHFFIEILRVVVHSFIV